jgi:hypothetical protein
MIVAKRAAGKTRVGRRAVLAGAAAAVTKPIRPMRGWNARG